MLTATGRFRESIDPLCLMLTLVPALRNSSGRPADSLPNTSVNGFSKRVSPNADVPLVMNG